MARIQTLSYNNAQTQGTRRRAWLQEHSPAHLRECAALTHEAIMQRRPDASRSIAVLGAGACTEIPLLELARAADEVTLADLDLPSMRQARAELPFPAQRQRVRLVECDLSGGISAALQQLIERQLIERQRWNDLRSQGARAVFDAAAQCLESCPVPDPPIIDGLGSGSFGVVISALVLTQLFSYPLLDILDHVQRIAPALVGEQERHHRYMEAATAFRTCVITAHLHLLRELLDRGGRVVLLSDIRGFAFNMHGTDHDEQHRRARPLVPRAFPDLVREAFEVVEERRWEWITNLPEKDTFGRGYEVAGYILS
jgi:hypothetical protein